ncbi:hypothetical protein OUZ56_033334 [Daphnia magna]|uniref:Uncharacterized protein n=1 Tax=Daphnia magna TaxID=35525 RepID=A0ABR0BAL8_9CRUS|nr:hypothetical protein OUZ56_033334 [Daphnia magna]
MKECATSSQAMRTGQWSNWRKVNDKTRCHRHLGQAEDSHKRDSEGKEVNGGEKDGSPYIAPLPTRLRPAISIA